MSDIKIVHARLIPMEGNNVVSDESRHIEVQFNPSTLRITLANNIKADTGAGNRNSAQYVGKCEGSLSVELLFDTTVTWQSGATQVEANSDVRIQTNRIADVFMGLQDPDSSRPKAPRRCRFQWGRFQFTGMLSSYSETLDFFAPEGIPLRATLALTLKEDSYRFEHGKVQAVKREQPTISAGGEGVTAVGITLAAGLNPREWRVVADANSLENPRFTLGISVTVPEISILRGV
jgi:hypothetical protein